MVKELKCPANYFGKGENYILPDNPEEIRDFERQFKDWEAKHPDDPTGEMALKNHKEVVRTTPKALPAQPVVIISERDANKVIFPSVAAKKGVIEDDPEFQNAELELELPKYLIAQLKAFAKYKSRRPRDIVASWIRLYARFGYPSQIQPPQ